MGSGARPAGGATAVLARRHVRLVDDLVDAARQDLALDLERLDRAALVELQHDLRGVAEHGAGRAARGGGAARSDEVDERALRARIEEQREVAPALPLRREVAGVDLRALAVDQSRTSSGRVSTASSMARLSMTFTPSTRTMAPPKRLGDGSGWLEPRGASSHSCGRSRRGRWARRGWGCSHGSGRRRRLGRAGELEARVLRLAELRMRMQGLTG